MFAVALYIASKTRANPWTDYIHSLPCICLYFLNWIGLHRIRAIVWHGIGQGRPRRDWIDNKVNTTSSWIRAFGVCDKGEYDSFGSCGQQAPRLTTVFKILPHFPNSHLKFNCYFVWGTIRGRLWIYICVVIFELSITFFFQVGLYITSQAFVQVTM